MSARSASRLAILAGLAWPSIASAQDHVLFVSTGWMGPKLWNYTAYGEYFYNELVRTGARSDYVNLAINPGGAAALLAAATRDGDPYDQVWVYDLSDGVDPYAADVQAIADWWLNESSLELICDGRILGSFYRNRTSTEGRRLVQNYYTNLQAEGGGLILATDHEVIARYFTNDIADRIGVGRFTGIYNTTFVVDTGNPLMNTPNLISRLSSDTTPGQAPFGLQANGLILDAVGYHSGNTRTPGLSSTLDGALNLVVRITNPAPDLILCATDTVTATATAAGVTGPVRFTWESSLDGELGGGPSVVLDGSALSEGVHTLRVIALDNLNIDDADVTIQVGGSTCVPPCRGDVATGDTDADGICDSDDRCPGFDDAADADGDLAPDACDPCPADNPDDADQDGYCASDDRCPGFDDNLNADADALPDGCDACPFDPENDADGDTVCGDVDACPGFDDRLDADGDGRADGCDACPLDPENDADGDTVCGDVDACPGFDDRLDADGDYLADGCDTCPYDAANDADADGLCGDVDACLATAPAAVIDGEGCSVDDRCPCDAGWSNHGGYVSCVAHTLQPYVDLGLYTQSAAADLQSAAAGSGCGQESNVRCDQGIGNGAEGCDPGRSNHTNPSNDEPGSPGRGR